MIDRKAYPILAALAVLLLSALTLTVVPLLRTVSPDFTPEGGTYRKAVRRYLAERGAASGRVSVLRIEDIDDLGRYVDPEWRRCMALSDSLMAVAVRLRPDAAGRRALLSEKRRELENAAGENRTCIEAQVSWLERLQGKTADDAALAALHEESFALERRGRALLREPGRRIEVSVHADGTEKLLTFVTPRDAVALTEISNR